MVEDWLCQHSSWVNCLLHERPSFFAKNQDCFLVGGWEIPFFENGGEKMVHVSGRFAAAAELNSATL